MKDLRLIMLLLVIFISFEIKSQICPAPNQWQWLTHSKWFYGEGNLMTFPGGTGSPTAGTVPGSLLWDQGTYESCASVCDSTGALLFFTNGKYLMDKNGNSIASNLLTGNEGGAQRGSAVQGVMIVKHPLNRTDYYIFTTDDALTATDRGLNYFIYNSTSNTVSGPTRIGSYRVTEQLAATWHANGVDIWISFHQSGTPNLSSVLLKCTGISGAPVVSNNVVLNASLRTDNERSCLKFSWDGTKAAATAHLGSGSWTTPSDALVLLNFNSASGSFTKSCAFGDGSFTDPYACEFSTDNAYLYITAVTTATTYRYSMASWGNGGAIAGTKTSISSQGIAGHLKVGGDGRMYKAGDGKLGTITGTAYTANPVNSSKTVTYSLPNMFVPPMDKLDIQPIGPFCQFDAPVDLSVKWKCKNTNAEDPINYPTAWSGPGITNAATGIFNPKIAGPGEHIIKYTLCTVADTLHIIVKKKPNVVLANKTICNTDPATTFDAGAGYTSYAWSANGTGTSRTTSGLAPGNYTVMVDSLGCKDTATAVLTVNTCVITCLDTTLKNPNALCLLQTLDLNTLKTSTTSPGVWSVTGSGAGWPTITGTTFSTSLITAPGNYTVRFTLNPAPTDVSCAKFSERIITVKALAEPVITSFGPLCSDSVLVTMAADLPGGLWYLQKNSTGAFNAELTGKFDPTVMGAGTHKVMYVAMGLNGCPGDDTISVIVNPRKNATITAVGPYCANNPSVNLQAVSAGGVWTGNGITNPNSGTFNPSNAGAGDHVITYTLAGACGDVKTTTIHVDPVRDATISPRNQTLCVLDPAVTINAAESGGTWTLQLKSGGAVTNLGNTQTLSFNPANYAAGLYQLIYSIANPCGDKDTIEITVISQFDATINTAKTLICETEAPFTINSVMPGGTWTSSCGACISNGIFSPALANAGVNTITYSYPGGCGDSKTINIDVKKKPVIVFSPFPPLCKGDALLDLKPFASPDTGIWSGTNVNAGKFNPVSGGTVTLTYEISGVCSVSKTADIFVNVKPNPIISGPTSVCGNLPGLQLSVDKTGGIWVGSGINSTGYFSTTNLAAGIYNIEYQMNAAQCPDTAKYTVEILNVPLTDFVADTTQGCIPLTVKFTDVSSEIPVSSIWNPTDNIQDLRRGTITYLYTTAGSFNVTLKNTYANGCVSSITKNNYITTYAIPKAEFYSTPDLVSIINPQVSFINQSSSDVTHWNWDFTAKGSPAISIKENVEVIFSSTEDDTIKVWLVVDNGQCFDSISHHVIIREVTTLFVANAFTPNGDGINDVFIPKGINNSDKGYEFLIFDRWGELIFRTTNASEGWNGKRDNNMREAQIDTYVWKVVYVDHFTETKADPMVGIVNLIR